MSGVMTAVVAGSVVSGVLSSKAQKDAAGKQADSIDNASRISAEAVAKARSDALALFNPAFADISTSLNQARGDLLSGRSSAQDILNQSFLQASSTVQTAGQQAMNAILGRSGSSQQPQIQPDPNQGGVQPQQPNQGIDPALLAELQAIQNGGGMPPQTGGILPAEEAPMNRPVIEPFQTPPFDPSGGGLRAEQMMQPQDSGLRQMQQPLPQMQFQDQSLRGNGFEQFQFNPSQQQF